MVLEYDFFFNNFFRWYLCLVLSVVFDTSWVLIRVVVSDVKFAHSSNNKTDLTFTSYFVEEFYL